MDKLTAFALAHATEELRSIGWTELPSWCKEVVAHSVRVESMSIRHDRLVPFIQRVTAYRREVGLEDSDQVASILGDVPVDDVTRLTRQLLSDEISRLKDSPELSRAR